jgi:predicted ATPase/class 3 adenylate cyclase
MQDAQSTTLQPAPPGGIVTLVFTDIQGSSDLWEQHRAAFKPVLDEHNRLVREAAARWNGYEVKTEGDAFFLVFSRASDGVRFGVDAQRALTAYPWKTVLPGLGVLRVRMGLHTGEPLLARHPNGVPDYYGPAVNRAARVGAAGCGGQVILSESTRALAGPELPPAITFLDLGEHRLKGVGAERLWQVCHPELPQQFPPLKTLDRIRHNLPLPPTPFIGREEEVYRWVTLLRAPDTRLLSLTGFGGLGKTRAALHLAELCVDEFRDGVWWVEVEEALNGDGMIQRIAYHLRVHVEPQPSVREQLWSFLREREMLLILDNTEQIPDAGNVLNELLAAAPGVRLLVTTRRALELRWERVAEVPPLPAPDAESLFLERARSRQPGFETTEDNREDVAELCRRLEGVPLAIELAATRVAAMTPREILQRLDDCFRLLQTRAPDLPPRQRALRGAIDWSHELLTEEDRELFAELSVFAGGFTMQSAEAVSQSYDVFEGISELRRHSLLRAETVATTQQTRFSMLEAVRQYAAEKLQNEQVRERHAGYFLCFAEERAERMRSPEEGHALDEMALEFDNLRAALLWAGQAERRELTARLGLAFYPLIHRRGFWAEAKRCLEMSLNAAQGLGAQGRSLEGSLRHCLASILHDMGDYEHAAKEGGTALRIRTDTGESRTAAETLNLLGLIAMDSGDAERSERHLEAARRLLPPEDHSRLALVLHNLARHQMGRGGTAAAKSLYEEALHHRRAAGDLRGEAETLSNLGVLAQDQGEMETAQRLYLESLRLSRALRDRHAIAILLNNLGELAEAAGDLEVAVPLLHHAERVFRDMGSAYIRVPQESLQRVAAAAGTERCAELQKAGNLMEWEQLVDRSYSWGPESAQADAGSLASP